MARQFTDEELAAKRADARMRTAIRGLFSSVPEAREDAIDALKEAWEFDKPSFDLDEIASMGPESAALAAMRRDTYKEMITWLSKI